MKRVCLNKLNNKLIEMQDGGTTQEHLQTLLNNAINLGYNLNDIEAKYITEEEWDVMYQSMVNECRLIELENKKDLDKHVKELIVVVKIMIDEINILRAKAGLANRTFEQFKTAFRNRMGE